jgi:CO/xanthine dehydrogenase FAD-binding subunit
MILEYHRPNDMDEALRLLDRGSPPTVPLAGGNLISRKTSADFAVVDLQNLGLNKIFEVGQAVNIGAMVTLEELFTHPAIPEAVKESVYIDATVNIRNTATVGGAIAAGTGASALLTALLAMDSQVDWLPGNLHQALGEFFSLKNKIRPGKLIVNIQLSLQANVRMAFVGRSPLDPPFLIVAVSSWPSGRTRLALGGKVKAPILALDGTTQDGIIEAGINACSHLSNQWISENYLKHTTSKLIQRLSEA